MITKKEEVLRQLKIVRKAKKISYQDIVDGTEEMGTAVSLTSVKRVFAEGSDVNSFNYAATIRPIVRVVMGVDGDMDEFESIEAAKANVEGLAAVVDYKDAIIANLQAELDRVHNNHRCTVEKMEAGENRKLEYLKAELDIARAATRSAEEKLSRWRTAAFMISGLLIVALLLVIAYLTLDRSDPDWGLFWSANPASPSVLFLGVTAVLAGTFAAFRKK